MKGIEIILISLGQVEAQSATSGAARGTSPNTVKADRGQDVNPHICLLSDKDTYASFFAHY